MFSNVASVVVTYSRPEELKLVVRSLLSQVAPPRVILVIDNASPKPAREVLVDFPSVEVIRSDENTGGAGGFALGLQAALLRGVDWVWLMDDDAIPEAGALDALLDASSKLSNDVGALCSSVYEYGKIALAHRRSFNYRFGIERVLPLNKYSDVCEIDTGSFVGFFVRATAAQEVGLPDKSFFLAYDDTEYSLRLKKHGWKLSLVPLSKIEHLRPQGSRLRHGTFSSKHFYNVRNRIYVLRQYCYWRGMGTFLGVLIGFAMWISSVKFWKFGNSRLFYRSIRDGCGGKLGKL